MQTHSSSDKISLGRGNGLEILDSIKKARSSVKIVSPYLSGSYLDELISLHEKGIKITLITSDNLSDSSSRFAFNESKIIKQEKTLVAGADKKKKNIQVYSLALFLIALSFFAMSAFLLQLIFFSLLFFVSSLSLFIYSYMIRQYDCKYHPIFRLKVFDSRSGDKPGSISLIHSKIFIIDEKICYLGSANFTYSGFKTHYETTIKVEDQKAIEDISHEIENLFNSTALKAKDIQEWGRMIYGKVSY
jgi:phosphatidylserine/phosphatidylglycerophosphate/cardiolipin synthase-like enzyme